MSDFENNNGMLNGEAKTGTPAGDMPQPSVFEPIEPQPVFNEVKYSEIKPVTNYTPISRGLKVFALIMAIVILVTGGCVTGYFMGKNTHKIIDYIKPSVTLEEVPQDENAKTAAQVYEAVNESVVGIMIYNKVGASQASGIVLNDEGYIVTNDHIYSEIDSPKFKVYDHNGKEYDAEYIAGDTVSDLAVLKVKGLDLKPAQFGNSEDIYFGQNVYAMGRPGNATEDTSITDGIISSVKKRITTTSSYSARVIQTTCAINPGSSGGALVNAYGQVVGITSAKLVSTQYDNVGYAIPTAVMKRIVDELIAEGKVISRAKLGVTYRMIDSVTAEMENRSVIGLLIDSVSEDSGLYGITQKGDMITHINNIPITNSHIVLDIIEESRAGDKVSVTIVDEGGTRTVQVELKANLSISSYSSDKPSINNGNGGTFDFPEGE